MELCSLCEKLFKKKKKTLWNWNEECDDVIQNFQFAVVVGGGCDLSYLL
jgi:hypothetical protein